jgi:cysteine desulfuration protein SufE
MQLDEIIDTFEFLDDWDDRFAYLIDLGKKLPDLPADAKVDANKVHGCTSQVWLVSDTVAGDPPRLSFRADSDAFIVRGLIAILQAAYDGQPVDRILAHDIAETFGRLGLNDHLSPNRQNGFFAMTDTVKRHAEQAMKAA